jgi:hypothetical protein
MEIAQPEIDIIYDGNIIQDSGCEQELVITGTCSRIVTVNNTCGGTLIQGITINNPQGDVYFMPSGI